jgi:hypothetical protein
MGKVVCTASHAVDLDTGRSLEPGEIAEDVDTDHPHNRGLILDGSLAVLEGSVPRKRQTDRLVDEAAKEENN